MEVVRIAGIDPGLRFTGYGVVNYNGETNEIWVSNCGVAKTPPKIKGIDAILDMQDRVSEILNRDCFIESDHCVVEIPAAIYSKTFSAGALIPVAAVAGGILMMVERDRVIPVYPTVWNESKKKEKTRKITEEMVGNYENWLYDDMPKAKGQFEHIIDAVSMALWYMRLNYLEQ